MQGRLRPVGHRVVHEGQRLGRLLALGRPGRAHEHRVGHPAQPDAGMQAAQLAARDLLDRDRHVGDGAGGRQPLAERQQQPVARRDRGRLLGPLAGLPAEPALDELGGAGDGEVLEGVQVGLGPRARDGVDRADRPDGPSGVVAQRPARVGDHADVGDRQVVPEPVVDAGVVDHQRLVVADDVLAERVRQRGLPRLHVLLGQAHGAREDLAIVLHDGDQGDRDGEGPADHPGVPVEAGGDHVGGRWLRVRHRVRRRSRVGCRACGPGSAACPAAGAPEPR